MKKGVVMEKNLKKLMESNKFTAKEEESFIKILKLAKLQYEGSYESVRNDIKKQVDKVIINENN